MATLYIDLHFGLSVDNTRNELGHYSRGCALDSFLRYIPKVSVEAGESKYFNVESQVIVFMSDHFGAEKPFNVTVFKSDNSTVEYKECNLLLLEATDLLGLKITNTGDSVYRCHIMV